MHVTSLWSVLTVFLSRVPVGLPTGDCKDAKYTTINDPRRSTAYHAPPSDYFCDEGLIRDNGWYRFSSVAGEEIPTKKPEHDRCGTALPIYINGSNPSVEEGIVNRTACAAAIFSRCYEAFTIKVRNCSGFYIYQLRKPKIACKFAYCAGSKLPNCTNSLPEDYCLKNRPPYITMPSRLYALEESEIRLFFNATDPEGYPLKYGYELTNRTNMSVAINPTKKTVTISRIKSGHVTLKVTDSIDKTDIIHTIEILTVPFSCQNGGTRSSNITVSTRREHISNNTCSCVKPYTGHFCETSPCDGFPCFPGLNCSLRDNGYKCEDCPSRFDGNGEKCRLLGEEDTVKVEGEFAIVSGLKWQAELSNNTSFLYKQQTTKIVTEIMKIYKDAKEFIHVVVTSYNRREKTVVVKFQMVFNKKMDNPLMLMKKHLQDSKGILGSFKVDANSIKEKQIPGPSSDDDLYYGLHKAVFIVVVCVVSVLAISAFVVCGICIKKKKISIIILSMTESGPERATPSSSNANAPSQRQTKPSRNQIMDLHSIATSTAGPC